MNAYLLAGPTAVGKTAIAQQLAEQLAISVLSTDSMQIYRGMDIGTAKPTEAERGDVPYFGLDLVDPDERFSTGDYVRSMVNSIPKESTVLAAGGTGLYLKALVYGLDDLPDANPALRAEMEALHEAEGVMALQVELGRRDGAWLEYVVDQENPRRLIRAIELATAGVPPPVKHAGLPKIALPGLQMDRAVLRERIALRVEQMFTQGLIEEVSALRTKFPTWSSTAEQAIGYAEIFQLLDGESSIDEAKERITIRTRQYAKRQMTWLNNQFDVHWVAAGDADAALQVRRYWETQGPVELQGC